LVFIGLKYQSVYKLAEIELSAMTAQCLGR